MTENPKKTGSELKNLQVQAEKNRKKSFRWFLSLLSNSKTLIPLISGFVQVLTGLSIVSVTILGFIQPLWLSAIFSLLGSITTMLGVFLIYHTFTSQETFESLINKAVKRVIRSQN